MTSTNRSIYRWIDKDGVSRLLPRWVCLWMFIAVLITVRRGGDLAAFAGFLTSEANMYCLVVLFVLLCPLPKAWRRKSQQLAVVLPPGPDAP